MERVYRVVSDSGHVFRSNKYPDGFYPSQKSAQYVVDRYIRNHPMFNGQTWYIQSAELLEWHDVD